LGLESKASVKPVNNSTRRDGVQAKDLKMTATQSQLLSEPRVSAKSAAKFRQTVSIAEPLAQAGLSAACDMPAQEVASGVRGSVGFSPSEPEGFKLNCAGSA
jgi:hypothetical protein